MYPFIALSQALKAAGAEPVVFVNPADVERFAAVGVEAVGVGDAIDIDTLLRENPKYFHPRNGTRFALEDLFAPFSGKTFAAAKALTTDRPPDICVSHHMGIGTAWLAKELGIPSVVVHLAPASLLSLADPPALGDAKTPPWLRRFVLKLALPMFGKMAAKIFTPHARDAGHNVASVDMTDLTRNPDLLLAMWSPAFRPRADDDPAVMKMTGFPTAPPGDGVSAELEAFLAAGEAPIGFGLGSSAVSVPGEFFEHAVAACRALGRRGILFMADRPHPTVDGDDVIPVGFEPFDAVVPRCAAFVHHASIGSTAAGLRAGIPTVAMPFAHDQFDNAQRLEKLGTAALLKAQGAHRRQDDPGTAQRPGRRRVAARGPGGQHPRRRRRRRQGGGGSGTERELDPVAGRLGDPRAHHPGDGNPCHGNERRFAVQPPQGKTATDAEAHLDRSVAPGVKRHRAFDDPHLHRRWPAGHQHQRHFGIHGTQQRPDPQAAVGQERRWRDPQGYPGPYRVTGNHGQPTHPQVHTVDGSGHRPAQPAGDTATEVQRTAPKRLLGEADSPGELQTGVEDIRPTGQFGANRRLPRHAGAGQVRPRDRDGHAFSLGQWRPFCPGRRHHGSRVDLPYRCQQDHRDQNTAGPYRASAHVGHPPWTASLRRLFNPQQASR